MIIGLEPVLTTTSSGSFSSSWIEIWNTDRVRAALGDAATVTHRVGICGIGVVLF